MKIVRRDVIDDSHLEPFIPDPVIRQILARRGIKTEQDVACKLCDIFHYKDFHDIEKASSIIADTIINQEPILVAGDYDVDGITGTALGVRGLKDLGAKDVTYYVSYLRTTIDNCENYDFDKMDLYKSSVSLFYHLIRASQNSSYTSMRRLRDFGLFIRDYGIPKRNSPFAYNMYEKKYLRRNDDNEYSLKVLREERKYWEFYNRLESENDRMLEDRELDRWDQEREGFSLELKM